MKDSRFIKTLKKLGTIRRGPTPIRIVPHSSGYKAVTKHIYNSETGTNQYEALGRLLFNNQQFFNVKIEI